MDSIGDGFTRIRNAAKARKESTNIPYSKTMENVLNLLKREGYLSRVSVEETGKHKKSLVAQIRYDRDGSPVLEHIRRISKPGQRVYAETPTNIKVRNGLGFQIFSTSKGLMD